MKKILLLIIYVLPLIFAPFSSAEEAGWKEYKKLHFIIYYKKAPIDFVEDVYETSEKYYKDIMHALGFVRYKNWNWDKRAKIYIYDSQEHFADSSSRYKWAAGTASARFKIIRTFPSASGFFDSTLPHELGHIIFREFIGINSIVPLWLEEGVAMHQERAKRWGSDSIVKKSIESGKFMDIDALTKLSLRRSSQETISLFYSESASLINYLIEEGSDFRFESLCRRLKKGEEFYAAFKRTYPQYRTMDKLNRIWVEHIKDE